jgi:hypothetical protein
MSVLYSVKVEGIDHFGHLNIGGIITLVSRGVCMNVA